MVPLVFNTLGPELHKIIYAIRKNVFNEVGKPCIHCLLQLRDADKMVAS
jgi:hypothetical protein